jgi:hypothetical protein
MPEVKQSRSVEETIARRMRNSGGEEADKTIKSGEGVRRVFHNIHLSGHQAQHGADNKGDMPPSALAAMVAAVPDRVLRDIVHDNRGPSTPTGMIPRSQQPAGGGPANVPGSGTGWAHETPIGPPPGLRYVDAQLDAQDAKDRQELIEKKARETGDAETRGE